jgi:hypothetical protein
VDGKGLGLFSCVDSVVCLFGNFFFRTTSKIEDFFVQNPLVISFSFCSCFVLFYLNSSFKSDGDWGEYSLAFAVKII